MGAWYIDTSAAVKLLVPEEHHEPMRAWARDNDEEMVSSDLLRAELLRAIRRRDPGLVLAAHALLDALVLVPLPGRGLTSAGLLDPITLRTLDAVHIAAALSIGDDLEGMVTYDARQADAARMQALHVVAPGV